ncbi:MAG: ribonuclease H-like domain-containing protein [Halodesulfurarchaeum sp.]
MRAENSFIPVQGVGPVTERRLWEAGVTHWDEFEPDLVGSTLASRIETFIEEARPRLERGDTPYLARAFPREEHWRLYENFRDRTLFFDIETTGLDRHRDRVTTVSFHQDGETTTLVRGENLSAGTLAEHFDNARLVATFNGSRFDVPFLETSFDVSIDRPHLDLMFLARRLDLTGGLKEIEGTLGIERERPDISGREAVRLWHEYERGDEGALETLVEYNREDTENLQTLAEVVVNRLHDRQVPDRCPL